MRKITFIMLAALSVATVNSFGADKKDKGDKTAKKCTMGSCCKKPTSRAALLKAKPVAKKIAS